MFGLPSAKRVRRDDLRSPASSPRSSPDPDLTELLRSRAQVEITYTTTNTNDPDNEDGAPASDAEETELILFAAPTLTASTTAPQVHRIRLTSPDVETDGSGFSRKKPRSYYFADEVGNGQEAYKSVAVTGDMVHELSQIPWPGCALPWKVRTIPSAGLKRSVLIGHPRKEFTGTDEAVEIKKKTRKGKKTRIAIRKGIKAKESKREKEERSKMVVDEQEKEKRARRNREKKLKKREREKAKKAAGGNVVGDVPGDESD